MANKEPSPARRGRPTGNKRVSKTSFRAASDLERIRRSKQGTDTQQKILAAARIVFTKLGYGGTRLEDIANEAGVSRTSLYHYFDSRHQLFVEVGRVAMLAFENVIEVARAIPDKWSHHHIASLVVAHLEYLDGHGAVIPIWLQASWSDPEIRQSGLEPQLRHFAAIGTEFTRLRGFEDIDAVQEGMAYSGMVDRLWYFARSGVGAMEHESLIRTVSTQVEASLNRPPSTQVSPAR